MEYINISLSNFNITRTSLQLISSFQEVKYNYLTNNESNSFFRKLTLEQGLEVIAFNLKSSEPIEIVQIESEIGYFGKYLIWEESHDSNLADQEKIVFTNHSKRTIHNVNPGIRTTGIAFIFNDRWLETRFQKPKIDLFIDNILNNNHRKGVKHNLKFKFDKINRSIISDDPNIFILRLKLYVLFQYCFEEIMALEMD